MLFLLMAKTGMRPGEAIALQPSDMDLQQQSNGLPRSAAK
jgi:integrase